MAGDGSSVCVCVCVCEREREETQIWRMGIVGNEFMYAGKSG